MYLQKLDVQYHRKWSYKLNGKCVDLNSAISLLLILREQFDILVNSCLYTKYGSVVSSWLAYLSLKMGNSQPRSFRRPQNPSASTSRQETVQHTNPSKTILCGFYTLVFVQVKQMSCDMLMCELQRGWQTDLLHLDRARLALFHPVSGPCAKLS